jgi:phenylalanine-4-hydroxylase
VEPDVFHDFFGHVPLLFNPVFADYLEAYGKGGLKADALGAIEMLSRLYWYTVEFGLIETASGLRAYGAGILSSGGELPHCIESAAPNRIGFDLLRIMRTRYKIDSFQETYFVIREFRELFAATAPDFTPHYSLLQGLEPHAADAVLATDRVLQGAERAAHAQGGSR